MDLEKRLRAYNATTTPLAENISKFDRAAARSQIIDAHPLSGESLILPSRIAVDFQRDIIHEKLLFFDLESTGLGSGEQVYPFLIGFSRITAAGCELTTLFAETPADEEFILTAFLRAAEGMTLVSFNGKSFDLPLILRRASKYDIDYNTRGYDHIDLYHLIRRIYPEKPARLIDAETRLLGFSREGDLSGAEVAQSYFELLRFGDTGLKAKILDHNRWDVLTLVSLLQKVSAAFFDARAGHNAWAYKIHRDKTADRGQKKALLLNSRRELDSRDLYALAQIFRSEKNLRRAVRHFLASYRAGYALAIVDAVRSLIRLKKAKTAQRAANFAMAREDERIQKHLVKYCKPSH